MAAPAACFPSGQPVHTERVSIQVPRARGAAPIKALSVGCAAPSQFGLLLALQVMVHVIGDWRVTGWIGRLPLVVGARSVGPARAGQLRQRDPLQAGGRGLHPDVLRVVIRELDLRSTPDAVATG